MVKRSGRFASSVSVLDQDIVPLKLPTNWPAPRVALLTVTLCERVCVNDRMRGMSLKCFESSLVEERNRDAFHCPFHP